MSGAGLMKLAGDPLGQLADTTIGSLAGSEAGGLISGVLSGALSGAAMGSLAGPLGAAIGAAVGGVSGLISGGSQVLQARDDAFKEYYTGLYDEAKSERTQAVVSGSSLAGQREQDLKALSTLLDEDAGAAARFQEELVEIGRTPPFSYDTVAAMSKSMIGLGLSTGEVTDRIAALGEAAAALDLKESGVSSIVSVLESAQLYGKLESRVLKTLSKQGIDVYEALSEEFGIAKEEVAGQVGDLDVERAVEAIYRYMGTHFAGASGGLTDTYAGAAGIVDSYKEDVEAAAGEGYNKERLMGLQAEIDAYSGALGAALEEQSRIAGENAAYLENLKEQYRREGLSAVLTGEETSLYSGGDAQQLAGMREEYERASAVYESSEDQEARRAAALKMEELAIQAEGVAQAAYEASEQYQMVRDAEAESLSALRENTSALEAASAAYSLAMERTKGMMGGLTDGSGYYEETYGSGPVATRGSGHAYGLDRVPYDDFPALLHQDERVLTARQAREMDLGGGAPVIQVNVSGNTFGAGMDETAVAQAIANEIALQVLGGFKG